MEAVEALTALPELSRLSLARVPTLTSEECSEAFVTLVRCAAVTGPAHIPQMAKHGGYLAALNLSQCYRLEADVMLRAAAHLGPSLTHLDLSECAMVRPRTCLSFLTRQVNDAIVAAVAAHAGNLHELHVCRYATACFSHLL